MPRRYLLGAISGLKLPLIQKESKLLNTKKKQPQSLIGTIGKTSKYSLFESNSVPPEKWLEVDENVTKTGLAKGYTQLTEEAKKVKEEGDHIDDEMLRKAAKQYLNDTDKSGEASVYQRTGVGVEVPPEKKNKEEVNEDIVNVAANATIRKEKTPSKKRWQGYRLSRPIPPGRKAEGMEKHKKRIKREGKTSRKRGGKHKKELVPRFKFSK